MSIELKKEKPEGYPVLFVALVAVALLVIAFNLFMLLAPGFSLNLPFTSQEQPGTATQLRVILLQAPDCPRCVDLGESAAQLFTVQIENATATEFEQLVLKYNVSKLPALVVTNQSVFASGVYSQIQPLLRQSEGVSIFEAPAPPFYDVAAKVVKGNVKLTSVSAANCEKCASVESLVQELEANGVYLEDVNVLQESSSEARELIESYGIGFTPVFVFSEDLLVYPQFAQAWPNLGSREADGSLVLRTPFPPYVNLSTAKVEGLVNVTYLVDSTCSSCYNVSLHRNVLLQYAVFIANESFVEVASEKGQELAGLYNITLVPTVVFSRDAGVYANLLKVWEDVGSVESDGSLVFRKLQNVPGLTYRNLASNETLNSTAVAG